jgi:hypothetical protein
MVLKHNRLCWWHQYHSYWYRWIKILKNLNQTFDDIITWFNNNLWTWNFEKPSLWSFGPWSVAIKRLKLFMIRKLSPGDRN